MSSTARNQDSEAASGKAVSPAAAELDALIIGAGFAGLYRAFDRPVVPIAIDSGVVWPKKGTKRAGVVTFRFGDPIPPGLSREAIEEQVHAAINALEG